MTVAALYVEKVSEYARVRWELAQTVAAERKAWHEYVELADSSLTSITARKEAADAATVGFRIDVLKLQARVDGLKAFIDMLDAFTRAGITELPSGGGS